MALANCNSCGRLFNRLNRDICPPCVQEEDRLFTAVREYLKEHRNAHTYEVSEQTGVEMKTLVRWIREGRLSTRDGLPPNMNYPCEACETPITDGRFCRSCKDRLSDALSKTKHELQSNPIVGDRPRGADYFHKRGRD